jgi:hypothetical protein
MSASGPGVWGASQRDRDLIAERAAKYGVSVWIDGPVEDGFVIDIRTDPKDAAPTIYRAIISAEGLRELGGQIDVLLRRYDAAQSGPE